MDLKNRWLRGDSVYATRRPASNGVHLSYLTETQPLTVEMRAC